MESLPSKWWIHRAASAASAYLQTLSVILSENCRSRRIYAQRFASGLETVQEKTVAPFWRTVLTFETMSRYPGTPVGHGDTGNAGTEAGCYGTKGCPREVLQHARRRSADP
jgi:hypothetical protein